MGGNEAAGTVRPNQPERQNGHDTAAARRRAAAVAPFSLLEFWRECAMIAVKGDAARDEVHILAHPGSESRAKRSAYSRSSGQ